MAEDKDDLMEKLVSLCKRRGFIFQSSEIYGGINGFWDYGPLGVELKRNVKNAWWEDIVRKRDDMVGLDSAIIMNPKVWEASGHAEGFTDLKVECKLCKARFRADKVLTVGFWPKDQAAELVEYRDFIEAKPGTPAAQEARRELISRKEALLAPVVKLGVEADTKEEAFQIVRLTNRQRKLVGDDPVRFAWTPTTRQEASACACPLCGGDLTEPRQFNLMFESHAGAVQDEASKVYLRPETAQGIFANYKNVLDTSRLKLPFGIAQIGKAFRNEINPRNYTFRSREFEQMEIEFFCRPDEADRWYEYWRDARFRWYVDHGLRSSRLRLRDHEPDELAHYARACADIEYEFPFGISELEGVANRTDFDLSQHQKFSGRDLTYFDDQTKERFIPYVIEPSGGVDRTALAFLCEAYCEDEAPDDKGRMQKRVVMKLAPRLAPIKAAVFPLVKKEGMPEIARGIYQELQGAGLAAFYDEKGAVGRRYRRQDEAGTPFCITVDGQTLEDRTVTVRDRDSLAQERIAADEILDYVRGRL